MEFTVDGKTFPAHRFILAARCPALAALVVAAESSPSSLTTINIDTMDPVAFEALLYFIYTGMIKTSTIDEPLLDAAKHSEWKRSNSSPWPAECARPNWKTMTTLNWTFLSNDVFFLLILPLCVIPNIIAIVVLVNLRLQSSKCV